MSFTDPHSKIQSSSQQAPLNSEEIRHARDQLAIMMHQGSKPRSKQSEDLTQEDGDDGDDDIYDSKHQVFVLNNKTLPDEGLASQTQFLMNNIVSTIKDQEIQNQLQALTDQELSKQLTNDDFKNMVNRMHQGISQQQQQLLQRSKHIEVNYGGFTDGSSLSRKTQSRSPLIQRKSNQATHKKSIEGYKPIHLRLEEIKQQKEKMKEKIASALYKEEPQPSFRPEINKNTDRILNRYSNKFNNSEGDWETFLSLMKEWEKKKDNNINERKAKIEYASKQNNSFKPAINLSTHSILEKSPFLQAEYGSNGQSDVVERQYTMMEVKKMRDKEIYDQVMEETPFAPKINANSEKIVQKMKMGEKIPVEDRLQKKIHFQSKKAQEKSKNQEINIQDDLTSSILTNKKLNISQLNTIPESDQDSAINITQRNKSSSIDKGHRLPNSPKNHLNQSKLTDNKISTPHNQQTMQQSANSSFNSSINGGFEQKKSNQNLPKTKDLLQLLNGGQNLMASLVSPESTMKNSGRFQEGDKNDTLSFKREFQKQIFDNKMPKKSILMQTPQIHIQAPEQIKISDSKIPSNNSDQLSQSTSFKEANEKIQDKQKRSPFGIASAQKLTKFENYQSQDSKKYLTKNNHLSTQSSVSPSKIPLNSNQQIRSPKLNHSTISGKQHNYIMKAQNLKADKEKLSQASKFEVLNSQNNPLKDLNNINQVEYGKNLKYIITLLRKKDPSYLTSPRKVEHQDVEQKIEIEIKNSNNKNKSKSRSPFKRK